MKVLCLALLLAAACGAETTGVTAVDFALEPSLSGEFPDDFDVARLWLASGTARVDVQAGIGAVTTQALPDAPDGYAYVLVLTFAGSEFSGLVPSAAEGLATVPADLILGQMEAAGAGSYSRSFGQGDVDKPLGALRAAAVLLFKTSGATRTGTALRGQAATSVSEGPGGHAHGV